MIRIIPAVIAKDQHELASFLKRLKEKVEWVQLDVMDGVFVQNTSLNFEFTLVEGLLYEAHIMVQEPLAWVKEHGDTVDGVIFHAEAIDEPDKVIAAVKGKGKRVGMAINPDTGVDEVVPYLDQLDMVLVMTVKPGYYGSPFEDSTLKKIQVLRKMTDIDIEADGGINPATIKSVADAGATSFVSGSFILQSDDVKLAGTRLRRAITGEHHDEQE